METIIACSKYGWETVTETYQRVTNPQKPIPDLHALIIGIDSYEKVVPLSGAVSDANSMERYLKVDLSVPCDHVTNLRNQQATRSAIIDAFRRLRDSTVIRPLDPIVIYYAGHGSEVDTPNSRKSNGPKTQCIVPQDVGLRDERGSIVSPIPDYVLSAMLYDLAEAKGNNITVIFDCCHSASSTRGLLDTYRIPHAGALTFPTLRSFNYPVMNLKSPRETIDTSSFGTNKVRYVDSASLPVLDHCFDGCPSLSRLPFNTRKTFRRGMRTHVLLAACGQSELAFECESVRNGYFTSTLLSVLRGSQIDKISYKSCLASFPLLKTPRPQNPVCEGEHVGRLFFNASIPGAHRSFIPVEQTEAGYTLEAGIAQGIFPGSVFSVHTNNVLGSDNPPLGTAVVTPVVDKPSASICNLEPAIFGSAPVPALLYARLIDVRTDPPLKVFLTGSFDLSCPRNAQLHDQNIVTSRDDAHIILDVDQSEHITFEIANSFVNAFGLRTLPRTILSNPSMVKTVLDATELWRWHVSRVPPVRPFASNVRMEFYRLDGDHHHPVGENLNKDGVATLAVREHESYGFKIVNESTRDLYPYLLFFSTVNQSIRPLFLKVFGSASVDPPLEAGTELTSDHLAPLYFHLGSTKLDVGMFRLFVTTCPADFESVAQPSPFSVLGCVAPGEDEFTDGVCVECGAGNQDAPTVRSVHPAVDQVLFGQSVAGETSRSSEPAIAEPPSMPVEQISGSLPLPTQDITNKSSPLSLEGPRVRRLVDDEDEVDAQIELQSMWDVIDMQIVLRVAG